VHGATSLVVTQKTDTSSRSDTLPLGDHAFPVTFSIESPPAGVPVSLDIEARDDAGAAIGRGTGTADAGAADATVTLESADFVVNTDVAMDQFLSDDYEANGLQLAAAPDGTWTVAFRDNCNQTGSCTMYARRFDVTGLPVKTAVAASTNAFPLSATPTDARSTPALATAGTTTLAFWDYYDAGGGSGVACRSIDAAGNASPGQLDLSNDAADVVTATSLSNGNVAVSWQVGFTPNAAIHTIVAKPDCSTVFVGAVTASTIEGQLDGPNRSHIGSNDGKVLYAWIVDGDVHVRPASNGASFGDVAVPIVHTSTQEVEAVRVSALGDGFAVVTRWAGTTGTGPGKIELYRTDSEGTLRGGPTLITDQSLSDYESGLQSFGLATRADGALLVAWHVCDASGSPDTCNVFGRVFRPTGAPVGDAFTIPTTTALGQSAPSVAALPDAFAVAWNDTSQTAPDPDGSAVRARIIYPPYDDATAVLGAACGGDRPACGAGLSCAMGSDGAQRCYETCTGMPGSCPHGGTCTGGACVF
jgi:hypothetical protein